MPAQNGAFSGDENEAPVPVTADEARDGHGLLFLQGVLGDAGGRSELLLSGKALEGDGIIFRPGVYEGKIVGCHRERVDRRNILRVPPGAGKVRENPGQGGAAPDPVGHLPGPVLPFPVGNIFKRAPPRQSEVSHGTVRRGRLQNFLKGGHPVRRGFPGRVPHPGKVVHTALGDGFHDRLNGEGRHVPGGVIGPFVAVFLFHPDEDAAVHQVFQEAGRQVFGELQVFCQVLACRGGRPR